MSQTTITLLFLVFAIVSFILEKIPLGLTASICALGLTLTGILDVSTTFSQYVNSNVILCVGMFVVGQALFEMGMANKIGGLVTRFAKTEKTLIIAIMVIAGVMSGFLSNTGTAAVLIPVVCGIADESGYSRSHLLMPLVFAAALGGNLSIIGAPGNLMGVNALQEMGIKTSFFMYAPIGIPMLLIGILYFVCFGYKLLPQNQNEAAQNLEEQKDFSNVPKWKQIISLVVLIVVIFAMIFEELIGISIQLLAEMRKNFPYINELEGLLKEAVVQATFAAPLRHNSVETFDEYNTKKNVGKGTPTVWWDIVPNSDKCEIYAYMAGGGCTLPGKAMVLMPGAGYEGITDFVLDQMTSYGLNACPPLLVGVGVGTSIETAALNSKKALMRPIGSHNENANAAKMERLLEDGINAIGLGSQGMGGKYSVMGVNIENTARHPSTIGVAVNVGCWSHRRGHIVVNPDLTVTCDTHSTWKFNA